MADSSRNVKKRKDGSKVVTRTTKGGKTVRKVLSAKGEDGKRTVKSTARTRTTAAGGTVTKKKGPGGATTKSRTRADGTKTAIKKNAKGTVVGIKKKDAEGNKSKMGSKSANVRAKRKIANSTTESRGAAGRLKRLQAKKAAGTGGKNLKAKIRGAKKKVISGIKKRRGAKES